MGEVKNNVERSRYEMAIDGEIAIADYLRRGDELLITHVETPEHMQGKGIAGQVMAGVVADAKERGLKITPICSYAVAYMKRIKG